MWMKFNQYYHAYHMMMQQGVFLKWCLEYISPYMLGNVCPNMVMIVLWDLIEKSCYINIWILPFIINW